MTELKNLQKQALESCAFRGHKMGQWENMDKEGKYSTCSYCDNCKAQVIVNVKPMPNEIDIGGTAVALNCK